MAAKPLSAAELSAIAGKEMPRGDCMAREILEAAASIREGLDNQTAQFERIADALTVQDGSVQWSLAEALLLIARGVTE